MEYDKVGLNCPKPPIIQIFIKTLLNTTLSIYISSSSTIADIAHDIYARDGIPTCNQRLLLGYREYSVDSKFSGLCVAGDTITLLASMIGGAKRRLRSSGLVSDANPKLMPVTWWIGCACYQDGLPQADGRIRHVLREFQFENGFPRRWYSNTDLSYWFGVELNEYHSMN